SLQVGCRVLVPFRKKSIVGVIVEFVEAAPKNTKVRDVTRVFDLIPAVTPKLLELGQWISSYYLAPVGEAFRSMLPPLPEASARPEVVLTAAGRAAADEHKRNFLLAENGAEESRALAELSKKAKPLSRAAVIKLGIGAELSQQLQRRGLVEIREVVKGRKQRT